MLLHQFDSESINSNGINELLKMLEQKNILSLYDSRGVTWWSSSSGKEAVKRVWVKPPIQWSLLASNLIYTEHCMDLDQSTNNIFFSM